ncbi:MAG: sugar transferase [Rhodothalassiaceae bacterium]|nr:MAG: sugar transferase [Rhodothalassiaceae bacterium]
MIRVFRHYVPGSLLLLSLIEIAILYFAYIFGESMRLKLAGLPPEPQTSAASDAIIYALVTYVSFVSVGLYRRHTTLDLRDTLLKLFVGVTIAAVALAVIGFIIRETPVWRSVLLIVTAEVLVLIPLVRFLFARIVDWAPLKHRVLLVGNGRLAEKLKDLAARREARFVLAGTLPWPAGGAGEGPRNPVLARARAVDADEIVVAPDARDAALVEHLLGCRLAGLPVTQASAFVERESGRVDLDLVDPATLVFAEGFVGGRFYERVLKRGFDVAVAAGLLVLTLPLQAVIALAVALTSPGPVLYAQERVGRGGRIFRLLKFRTMVADAEREGARWAAENDPRVTPVGRILRKTRLDELPQLVNVLKGEMSVVGPRPERPVFVEELARRIPLYRERHAMKPGITGWAQLNYPYGASVEDARIKLEYDLYYIKNYTLFLDMLIIAQTLRVILFADGGR